jgi:CheY-like chemotaxis protein/HPt (histidine-containing phosphotransfer) domain-containing protein
VLLADDDEVTCEVLGRMLEDAGYECEPVTRGDEAVTQALSGRFAALILDYELPVLSGLEVALRIRRLERGVKLPIIVLSAHTEKRGMVLGAGANAYLVKPVSSRTLRTTLASWVSAGAEPEPVLADVERHSDLLDLFFELVPGRIQRIHDSALRQDLSAVRAEAHRLIGSCAVLGFPRMADVARRVASGEITAALGVQRLTHELERIEAETTRGAVCST